MLWDQEAPLQCCVCLWGCMQTTGPGPGGCWLLRILPFVYCSLQPQFETNPEGDKSDYGEGSLGKTGKPYQEWQGWDMQRGLSSPLGWGIKIAQAKNITSILELSKLFVCTTAASWISIRDLADPVALDIVLFPYCTWDDPSLQSKVGAQGRGKWWILITTCSPGCQHSSVTSQTTTATSAVTAVALPK